MIKSNFFLLIASIILSVLLFKLMSALTFSDDLNSIIQTCIQSVSGLMGFLLASAALIFSFGENKKVERLRRSDKYKDLLIKYTTAIFWMGIVTVSGIFIEIVQINYVDPYWLVFALSIVSVSLFDLILITHKILILTSNDN